ncbi:nucleoside deaminase, partial [Candidatus Magnetaquicoccus inordinatus]|uniref:nucleoside deaminase n=1 Tax=Candidatus Magnetaquicoccus inordinatus TaxID=2496818 RepID=UPI001D0E7E3D
QAALLLALLAAAQAGTEEEVPVGAVLRDEHGRFLAAAGNQPISSQDPTAHAEILVLRQAARRLGNYRLNDTTMSVTLQPCLMCRSAAFHARVSRIQSAALRTQSTLEQELSNCTAPEEMLFLGEGGELLRIFFDKRRHL